MALPSAQHIYAYRGLIGGPRRGLGTPHASYAALVADIRRQAKRLESCDAQQFSQAAEELRERVLAGAPVTSAEVVCRAFALTAAAVHRTLGMTYFDVQLVAGLVLAAGAIAEIQTGEGKTIVTALPAVLHALSGEGVHVATTNEYLSQRDFEELKPAYELLGLRAGLLEPQGPPAQKRTAYACDVTYGPGYEFGFDFLRDQWALRSRHKDPLGARYLQRIRGQTLAQGETVQRGHAFAIIDEADSVLIDEATTPLILSGASAHSSPTDPRLYHYACDLAARLECERDFHLDEAKRAVCFTQTGWETIHQAFQARPTGQLARPWSHLVENALRAALLLHRDVDYVVREAQVMIVDQNTGRIHAERTWRSGLHQAVEVSEGLPPTEEKETQARITRQRYCRYYRRMSGLTGTARGSDAEFREFYGLPVVAIPTNRPCRREVLPPRYFATNEAKYEAIAEDVRNRQQPVLIGTRTVRESRALSEAMQRSGITHTVLNGLQDASEASIVARAGTAGTVTVATNMAGRGTDIRLDRQAAEAGGLHVVASELHEAQRVDRQLAGRAARQGDPGSCQAFTSAEDELLSRHAPELAARMKRHATELGVCRIDVTTEIEQLQTNLERESLIGRRRLVAHDQWTESVQSTLARA